MLFLFLLLIALHNSYFFLYKQKRYRIYFITVFYTLAYIVILIRIAVAIDLIVLAIEDHRSVESISNYDKAIFLGLETVATYAKISMGFFVVAAMIILTLQVRQKFIDSIITIQWWLYFGVTVWTGILILSACIFEYLVLECI